MLSPSLQASCLAAAVDWPFDGAQARIDAVRLDLDRDAERGLAIVGWLKSGSVAMRDWFLWQVVPIVVFALAWLGFCAFCFTVLVPSGELGIDQWRAKLMTTVGVIAASVFWISFVTVRFDRRLPDYAHRPPLVVLTFCNPSLLAGGPPQRGGIDAEREQQTRHD